MPKGAITSLALDSGGSGYSGTITVTISDVYGTGFGATATATQLGGVINSITLGNPGTGYTAPVVTITGTTGTGAAATATIGGTPGSLSGGIRKFVDPLPGIPIAVPDVSTYPPGGVGYTSAPTISITDSTGTGASATANMAGSTVGSVTVNNGGSGYTVEPVITFLGGGASTQAIGKATVVGGVITGITLLGCDYYEIELGEYTLQMHSDLPATKLRGYKQTNMGQGVNGFHYLGPLIVAERDRPVRVKFTNSLPTGDGGDLFIPVDTTVMGSGMGPNMAMVAAATPVAGATVEITTTATHTFQAGARVMLHGFLPDVYNGEFRVLPTGLDATHFQVTLKATPVGAPSTLGKIMEMYAQNRAAVHLHGGYVPWISDGTPHQWTTPAAEITSYPKGVSVRNIPDMPECGPRITDVLL